MHSRKLGLATVCRWLLLGAAACIGALIVALAAVLISASLYPEALAHELLPILAKATGSRIRASSLAFRLAPTGIEVIANNVHVLYHREPAQSVNAIVGYRALSGFHLLPLESVSLSAPKATFKRGNRSLTWSDYIAESSKLPTS